MQDELKGKGDIFSQVNGDFPSTLSEADKTSLRNIFREFLTGFSMMVDKGPFVTVFGSSKITPEKYEYKLGMELGSGLAKLGYSVLTGGGPGLMEAVNKGAHDARGRSMGINISIPSEQEANPYTDPSITIKHFFVRKVLLLKYSSAYIFLPGGFGTLDELFETITLVQTQKIKPLPIILMRSEFWSGLMEWIRGRLLVEGLILAEDVNSLYFADTVEDAIEIVKSKAVLYEKP